MREDNSDPQVITTPTDQTDESEDKRVAQVQKYSTKQNRQDELMDIKVSSPFVTYFNDEAFSISAENTSGPFDILPGHHNFISLLAACIMIIRNKDGQEQKISISGGLMHVKADRVIVFLDV